MLRTRSLVVSSALTPLPHVTHPPLSPQYYPAGSTSNRLAMHLDDLKRRIPAASVAPWEYETLLSSRCCSACMYAFMDQARSPSNLSIEMMRLHRPDMCDWATRILFTPLPNDLEDVPSLEHQLRRNSSGCPEGWDVGEYDMNNTIVGSPRLKTLVVGLCRFVSSLLLTGSGAIVSVEVRAGLAEIDWNKRSKLQVWPQTMSQLFSDHDGSRAVQALAMWGTVFPDTEAITALLGVLAWSFRTVVPHIVNDTTSSKRVMDMLVGLLESEPVDSPVAEPVHNVANLPFGLPSPNHGGMPPGRPLVSSSGQNQTPINISALRTNLCAAFSLLSGIAGPFCSSNVGRFIVRDPGRMLHALMSAIGPSDVVSSSNGHALLPMWIHSAWTIAQGQGLEPRFRGARVTSKQLYSALVRLDSTDSMRNVLNAMQAAMDGASCSKPNCCHSIPPFGRPGRMCCAACGVPAYCSKECQSRDWKNGPTTEEGSVPHKKACPILAKLASKTAFARRAVGEQFDDECDIRARFELLRPERELLLQWARSLA